jgi:hypothetical protein
MRRSIFVFALACGCGPQFIDVAEGDKRAATPERVASVYSVNEDLTVITWLAATLPDELPGDFELIAGERSWPWIEVAVQASSRGGSAWAALVPGRIALASLRYTPPAPSRPALYSLSAEGAEGAVALSAAFAADTRSIDLAVTDPFAEVGDVQLARAFVVDLRDPACGDVLARAEIQGLGSLTASSLSADGQYCATLDSGAAHLRVALATHPELETYEHAYRPPLRTSRVVVLPVFNLELPDASRCQATIAGLAAAIAETASSLDGAAVTTTLVSPPAPTDGSCRHTDDALVDDALLDERLGGLFGSPDATAVLVYVDNLGAPLSAALVGALAEARRWAERRSGLLQLATLAPPVVWASLPFDATATWTYSEDPGLPALADSLLRALVPYRAYVHDAHELVPFFAEGTPAFLGYKVCAASRPIAVRNDVGAPYVPMDDAAAGYWVELPSAWMPAGSFSPVAVQARLEACSRFCAQAGENWSTASGCGNTP